MSGLVVSRKIHRSGGFFSLQNNGEQSIILENSENNQGGLLMNDYSNVKRESLQRDLISFSGFIHSPKKYNQQTEWSNTKIEHTNIQNVVFEHCHLNNVSIENCHVTGLKINGIDVEDLLTNYYENQAPLIDMAREL